MSDQEVTKEEINEMVETLDTFMKMVKNPGSFIKSNREAELAMTSARQVEDTYKTLRTKQLQFLLIEYMCKILQIEEDSVNISLIQNACDTLLQAILTSNNVPVSCLLCCLDTYIELCGKNRMIQLLSVTIVHSEACRVLLDFVGTLEDDSQVSVNFQANLLLKTLTAKGNETSVNHTIYNWLNSTEESRLQIVFDAISMAGVKHDISKTLIKGLTSVLDDRRESAVLYWSTVITSPLSISVMKESLSLLYASLDFLSKCAENFKQTEEFRWISHEEGPCQVITFEMIVKYVHFLKSDVSLKPLVENFISERCCLPGCMFWEDVILGLLE